MVSVSISLLLSLINIGSTVAFNSLVSLGSGTLMISYIVCISCFVSRRFSAEPMLPTKFDLGKFGMPINIVAICYLALVFIVAFFPAVPIPLLTVQSMNWSSLIFVAVLIWSMVYYFVWSRHVYQGPVQTVRKEWDDGYPTQSQG